MTTGAGKNPGGFLKRGFEVPEGHLDFNKEAGQGLRGAGPLQVERTAGADAKAGNLAPITFWGLVQKSRRTSPVLGPGGQGCYSGELPQPLEAWGKGESSGQQLGSGAGRRLDGSGRERPGVGEMPE